VAKRHVIASSNEEQDGLSCRIIAVDVEADLSEGNVVDDSFRCLTEDGMLYSLYLPSEFIQEHSDLARGETHVLIPSGHAIIEEDENGLPAIVYPNTTSLVTIPPPNRRLLSVQDRREGVKRVLVLRVDGADSRLSLTQSDLSKRIFGIGSGAPAVNIRSQYQACSFGKFRVVPAIGTGITNGVATVTIGNVKGKNPFNLENQAVTAAQNKLQIGDLEAVFDHVLICLPPGTLYDGTRAQWYAYGYLNYYRTVYNDKWGGYYSVPMHEIGHNLALQHSSEGSPSGYGDQSGMMGYSYSEIGAPSMCFNGHKNYLLRWYSDRTTEFYPSRAWSGLLYAFVDYDRTPQNSFVLIRVRDLYVQYNRARRFNSGTREKRNEVTITRGPNENAQSILLGSVGIGNGKERIHRVSNFAGTGHSLVFEACEQVYGPPDYVRLSIYLDDGSQQSTCSALAEPTPLPTQPPTPRPTLRPTRKPTASPTPNPTLKLSTPRPTPSPTSPPTTTLTGSGFCDDNSSASIRLDPNKPTPQVSCLQLRNNEALRNSLCVPTHEAYSECRETCGACQDSCQDSTSKRFFVNNMWGEQDCKWLEEKPVFQDFLCHPSHPANKICGETCGTCDVGYSPPDPPYKADCDDSPTGTFLLPNGSSKDCIWLSMNAIWHSRLCVPGKPSYDLCEETCRKCTDNCVDDEDATFFVNSKQGIKDCKWLSKKPAHQQSLCVEGKEPYRVCMETCNIC
jgi:hypothetical protein